MPTLVHRGKKLARIVPFNYTTKFDIGLYRVGPRVGGGRVGSDLKLYWLKHSWKTSLPK
jgi:hypothetical protein